MNDIDLTTIGNNHVLLCDSPAFAHSQAFAINSAANPLVAASAPLLTIATQLREQRLPPELIPLHDSLSHEIKVFENKARAAGLRSSTILAGRYFLCAFIDEVILTTTWGADSRWTQHNLLRTFQREAMGGERFFMIIERCLEDPTLHIDLLELGYLCLSLGYKGNLHKKLKQPQDLVPLLDKLYAIILDARGEYTRSLLVSTPATTTATRKRIPLPPVWVTVCIALAAMCGVYATYHVKLDRLKQPVHTILQTLSQDQRAATHDE